MRVLLDGSTYELDGGVQREAIPEWPQFQPDIGKRRREDRAYISSYAKESWGGGFGILKSLPEVDLDRFWDADAETRFPGQITPPPLATQDPITPATRLLHMYSFKGSLYALTAGTGSVVGTCLAHYLYKFASGVGWGSLMVIGTTLATVAVSVPVGSGVANSFLALGMASDPVTGFLKCMFHADTTSTQESTAAGGDDTADTGVRKLLVGVVVV